MFSAFLELITFYAMKFVISIYHLVGPAVFSFLFLFLCVSYIFGVISFLGYHLKSKDEIIGLKGKIQYIIFSNKLKKNSLKRELQEEKGRRKWDQ